MEIKRPSYLQKLIHKKHNGMIKIITGMRRCGKSYLLFTLFKQHLLESGVDAAHIIEISFDSFENEQYRDPYVLYPYIKNLIKDSNQYYILFDEVQMLGKFEDVLNGLMRIANVDVYVTGSNARFLSKDIITEFRGRGDEVHMQPLSFAEFMSVYEGDKRSGWEEYILFGGLPLVVLRKDEGEKIELLKALFEETYVNDIVNRYHLRNKAVIEDLLNIISSSIGSLTNVQKLVNAFKSLKHMNVSPTTIKRYLEILSDSFLITAAHRYDVKGKKYIETPLKYYFTDIGLRNARINFRQLEENHTMENVIFNEMLLRGFNVDVGVVTVNKKNEQGVSQRQQLEIDFVCNKGSKRYYIQSAFMMPDAGKLAQEQRSLLNVDDTYKKVIVAKDVLRPWYTEEGVLVIGIYDFLLDAASMEQ